MIASDSHFVDHDSQRARMKINGMRHESNKELSTSDKTIIKDARDASFFDAHTSPLFAKLGKSPKIFDSFLLKHLVNIM